MRAMKVSLLSYPASRWISPLFNLDLRPFGDRGCAEGKPRDGSGGVDSRAWLPGDAQQAFAD